MLNFQVVFILTILILVIDSKTYYFSYNKTSNEYMIRSRYDPSNSMSTYTSGVYMSELRNNVTRKKNLSEIETHALLDPEWDYNWKNVTRPKLPIYIHKYYDNYSKNITSPVRFLFNSKRQNSTIIKFNISEIDPDENITEVELHFFLRIDHELLEKSLILRLYQIDNYINETSLINPDSHKLLNVIYVYQAENSWQIFKITNSLVGFLKTRDDLSLFITISKPNHEQFNLFKDGNHDSSRTFLLLKSESSQFDYMGFGEVESLSLCRKHEFYVDFKKLNWMKFIISPQGYQAFNCYGSCNRYDHHLPNYIKVTSFAPEISRKALCCSAVRYSPLSIMFYDRQGNVVLKSYPEMIITDCGCR